MSRENLPFDLPLFLPYRLAVLTEAVSKSVAQVYGDRFRLTRAEWRVLATLGEQQDLTAKEISQHTTLDKMQVSRAVARLERDGFLTRAEDPGDRRNKVLRLSKKGEALLEKIVPLVLAREEFLLSALSPEERRLYLESSAKILARAQELLERG